MPAQTSKVQSPIAAIVRAHAGDKVDYGQDFSALPGGISGGVAELIECKTGRYKKGDNVGKPYFSARGTVISPATGVETVSKFDKGRVVIVSQQEVPVKGRQTKCSGGPMPLCATKTKAGKETTVEDAYVAVINELKKLGGEECTLSLGELPESATEAQVLAAIDAIGKALVEARVRFRFNTRQGTPSADYPNNPRVWEEWKGAIGADEDLGASPNGVVDNTGEAEEAQPESAEAATEEAPTEEGGENLAELVAATTGPGKAAAQQRLIELAVEAGIDKDTAEAADSWQEVADMIEQARAGGEGEGEPEAEPEPEPWKPTVGEQYDHFPMVKNKAGKLVKASKAVSCVVTAVDEAKQTLTLKNGRVEYKNLKWAAFAPKD